MPFKILIFSILLLAIGLGPVSYGSSGGGGEGKGEGEGAGAEAADTTGGKVIPEEDDWAKQVAKLNTYQGRIKDYRKQIIELAKEKKATDDVNVKNEIVKRMTRIYEELKEEMGYYNKLKAKIAHRFPNKNKYIEQRYLPMRLQSLEQLEGQSGLDVELTLLRKKIQKTYEPFTSEDQKLKQEIETEDAPKKKKSLKLEM